MPWSTISESDVLSEFNSKEQAQLVSIQGAVDNLPAILGRVVNATRSSILAGGGQLDAAGTIPDQLRSDVISIARWKWLISLPQVNETLQSKNRKDAHDAAQKRLDDVAAAKLKVEPPSAATVVATTAPTNAVAVPRAGRRVHHRGFEKMSET
jgi:hypothetical protein